MSSDSSILCPQDFSSCSARALEYACDLARALQHPIELMHVYQLPYFPEPALGMGVALTLEGLDLLRARAAEQLQEQKELVESAGLAATVRLAEGNPAALVSQRAQAPDISVVVMGTHGRNALGRAFLGSVAERVLRTSKVPVMTVCAKAQTVERAGVRKSEASMAFQKILVAYDFSEPSDRALKFAFRLARSGGGQLDIIHVQPEFYLPEGEPALGVPWPTPEQSERYTRFIESELSRLVPSDLSGQVRCAVRDGDPKAMLVAEAERLGADLLCIGATGKGAVERTLLGSVSQSLVRHSRIPVITVP